MTACRRAQRWGCMQINFPSTPFLVSGYAVLYHSIPCCDIFSLTSTSFCLLPPFGIWLQLLITTHKKHLRHNVPSYLSVSRLNTADLLHGCDVGASWKWQKSLLLNLNYRSSLHHTPHTPIPPLSIRRQHHACHLCWLEKMCRADNKDNKQHSANVE